MLPDFVVIGAMKAGTTSLYAYLRSHPQIFMASPKELDFFNRNWERGRSWYEAQFEGATGSKAAGEASPNYTKAHLWPATASRMASLLPGARLIYVLRDPVERMRSMYLHLVADGSEDRAIERALRDEDDPRTRDYLYTSRYGFQLERYLGHFDRRQILVVTSEALRHRRIDTLRVVFRFLRVEEGWVPSNVDAEMHRTDRKVVRNRLARRLRGLPGYERLAAHAPYALKLIHYRLTTRPPVQAELSEELRADLRERLRPDVERLRTLLGTSQEFEGWGIG